jgi:thiamine pyrophosphokinase
MKRALVFANGRMDDLPAIIEDIRQSDLILAADGGTHHCEKLGIKPDAVIGDFDSLEPSDLENLKRDGITMIRYPSHKDETDLELVLNYALAQEIDEIYIIGGLGSRWDMTFANTLLAANSRFSDLTIWLVDGSQELTILKGAGKIEFSAKSGGSLSLIPLGGDARGVTTRGLEYSLANETLIFGSPRGVSNVIIDEDAWVSLDKGILLVCVTYQALG